jgi:hypothetical protein
MSQRSRWDLPQTVLPSGTRCFLVPVPDERAYIAAFRGALYDLAKPYAWGNDQNHTALAVAARCLEMWTDIEEINCDMANLQMRACQAGCGVEYSLDGGANWTCIDLSSCIETVWDEKLAQAIDDGVLSQGDGQPGPEPAPTGGQCQTWHVVLRANDRWQCPIPVQTNSTIEIKNARGGWWDGDPLDSWRCPDGHVYILGYCAGTTKTVPEDPLNTSPHMRVIGQIGTTYFDALDSLYTVGGGVSETALFITANDALRADNEGQIEIDVTVCSGFWCFYIDLTATDGGFVTYGDDPNQGTWEAGVGWHGGHYLQWADLWLKREFDPTVILAIAYNYAMVSGDDQDSEHLYTKLAGDTVADAGYQHYHTFSGTKSASLPGRADTLVVDLNAGSFELGSSVLLTAIVFYGNGTCPFGTPNC